MPLLISFKKMACASIKFGYEDIVKILYNNGANIGAEGLHRYSPLHIAVIDGKVRTHLLNKSNF